MAFAIREWRNAALLYCAEMLTDSMRYVARLSARATRCLAFLFAFAVVAGAHADDIARTGGPYVPTPQEVVDRMLDLAQVGPQDFVIDLGSGDGRMVITAARRNGARGLGVDIDGELVERSTAEAQRLGLADRVRFRTEDVTRTPLKEASVVTLYLLPGLMKQLEPRFLGELAPGARIVAHDFSFGDWKPDREMVVDVKEKYGSVGTWKSTLFLWTVPARVGGLWQLDMAAPIAERMLVRFDQRYQEIAGVAMRSGASRELSAGRVEGTRVRFRLSGEGGQSDTQYEGSIESGRMQGTLERRGTRASWPATRLSEGGAR